MAVTNFKARQATVAYATGAITWDASTNISLETFTGDVSEIKNVTLTVPEMGTEKIPCLGSIAQTIGANHRTAGTATGIVAATFQCMALIPTSVSNWKIEGTAVLTGDEQFSHILGLDSGSAIADTHASHRYALGNLSSGAFARNFLGTVRVFLNNGSEETTVGMTNVMVTKIGDIKPTDASGHFEVDFSIECLTKDGAIEWKD